MVCLIIFLATYYFLISFSGDNVNNLDNNNNLFTLYFFILFIVVVIIGLILSSFITKINSIKVFNSMLRDVYLETKHYSLDRLILLQYPFIMNPLVLRHPSVIFLVGIIICRNGYLEQGKELIDIAIMKDKKLNVIDIDNYKLNYNDSEFLFNIIRNDKKLSKIFTFLKLNEFTTVMGSQQ